MPEIPSFTSKTLASTATEKVPFRLDGMLLTAVLRTDGDAVMEWSEMAAAADDTDLSTAAGAQFISRFFRLMLPGGEYARMRAHMRQRYEAGRPVDPDVFAEIIQMLNERMEAAIEEDTGRPTVPPSRSSPGRGDRDERIRLVSDLPAGDMDLVFAEPPLTRRPPARNPRRKQGRRRSA